MKTIIRIGMKAILIAFMLMMLPGINNRVLANEEETNAPKDLKAGVTYNVGDIIRISNNTVWVNSSNWGDTSKREIKGNRTYTMPQPRFSPPYIGYGSWFVEDLFKDTADDDIDLYFDNYYIQKFGDKYYSTGIRCYSGAGTQDDPYRFEIILVEMPTVSVTIDLGSGHEDLAKKTDSAVTDGATAITKTYPLLDYSAATKKWKDLHDDLSKTVTDAIEGSDKIDNDQYLFELAPNPISSYSSTAAITADLQNYYTNDLAAGTSYTLNAIWLNPISEISITIDNPSAGTEITYTRDDALDQTPVPSFKYDSNQYNLVKKSIDGTGERYGVFYAENLEDSPHYYKDKVMMAGESYSVYAMLEPTFGYFFPTTVNFTVNGENVPAEDVQSFKKEYLAFFCDIEALAVEYNCIDGYNAEWQKGSSSGIEFEFRGSPEDNAFALRQGIKVDGVEVSKDNYSEEEGSWIIKLEPSYLETLSEGDHALTALFKGGMSSTVKFTIRKQSSSDGESSKSSSNVYRFPITGIE